VKQRVLIFLLTTCLPSWATTYYVLAGGAGNHKGTDWANADCKIPASPAAGDDIYIGNSGGNLADTTTPCAGEATHVFNTSGTAGSHIKIKAATGPDHGTATGWKASFGVDVTPKITWSNAFTPSDGLKSSFWEFCGNYYDIDGKVGNSDQTGTYGFYFKSAGRMFGFIHIETHACGEISLNDFTFTKLEIDGVEANSTAGGTQAAADATYIGTVVSATATVTNVSFTNTYMHDTGDGFIGPCGSTTGVTITNNWFYTNFSDVAEHSNAIGCSKPTGTTMGGNNFTIANNVLKNIQGTAVIICLQGTCDGWNVYNNIIYYTSDWDSICEHGDTTATCGISKVMGDNIGADNKLTNSVFYENTIANIHIKPGHAGADQAGIVIQTNGSSGNIVENNFWFKCTAGDIFQNSKISHDYNTWSSTSSSSTMLNKNEFNNGLQPDPFVADATGDFRLSSETVNPHLNDGAALAAAFSFDLNNVPRGLHGTWERGAFQFKPGSASNPPTSLQVTRIH
jgi:hypothetical protein